MTIVVNDANVLIDLVNLKLLPHFFSLNLIFHTSSLIMEELHQEQRDQLQEFIDNGILNVLELSTDEISQVNDLQMEKPQLSEQDCSAIVCAQKVKGELLTSDNNLRKFAKTKSVVVRGHLWVFDLMIVEQKINGATAIAKLNELRKVVNPRLGLPVHECEMRLNNWKAGKTI